MVKAIGGLSLMPSDTGAMPQKIHPNSCIEGKPENPGNPGVSRPSQAIFYPLSWEKSPWKVAISGFYKKLTFTVVSPFEGKPVILDDTSYFLSCRTEEEATYIASLLNSDIAREFFSAFIFWDSKRPITVD